MSSFTIYVETREKKPYKFHQYPVSTEDQRLETGDYCVKGDGEMVSNKTVDPNYCVERKEASDFLHSITYSRDRFEDELERADFMSPRMPIVVERPWEYFIEKEYYAYVEPEEIIEVVDIHSKVYNCEYFYMEDRVKSEQLVYEFLKRRNNYIENRNFKMDYKLK